MYHPTGRVGRYLIYVLINQPRSRCALAAHRTRSSAILSKLSKVDCKVGRNPCVQPLSGTAHTRSQRRRKPVGFPPAVAVRPGVAKMGGVNLVTDVPVSHGPVAQLESVIEGPR